MKIYTDQQIIDHVRRIEKTLKWAEDLKTGLSHQSKNLVRDWCEEQYEQVVYALVNPAKLTVNFRDARPCIVRTFKGKQCYVGTDTYSAGNTLIPWLEELTGVKFEHYIKYLLLNYIRDLSRDEKLLKKPFFTQPLVEHDPETLR